MFCALFSLGFSKEEGHGVLGCCSSTFVEYGGVTILSSCYQRGYIVYVLCFGFAIVLGLDRKSSFGF